MINNFSKSLEAVLKAEGGFTDDPRDPGNKLDDGRAGCTNMGVTQAAWETYLGHKVSTADMKSLTKEQVGEFYKKKYWTPIQADALPTGIDFLAFSFAINSGIGSSAKRIQECVGATPDGVIGPRTLQFIAGHDPKDLVEKFSQAKENFYRSLKTFPTFGKGWLNRVESEKAIALTML
jgi:lysozyme family protein